MLITGFLTLACRRSSWRQS